jgi:oxygen-dependent protoporphyrinogen oxidase
MTAGPGRPRIVVIGGGLSGLAAAHRVVETGEPVDVTLLEARPRLGGTVGTEEAGGFLVEQGADSFVTDKPWALALAERLGLGPRLVATDDRFRRVYVVRRGRLHPLPEGWLLIGPTRLGPVWRSPLLSWPGKARLALDLVRPARRSREDESVAAFVARRLGPEALERIVQPLAGGIYTADPRALSLQATLPRFATLEREHGSVIRGLRRTAAAREVRGASGARFGLFASLAGGLGELAAALVSRLPAGVVRTSCPAAGLERDDDGGRWRVRLASGESLGALAVILAGEAPRMGPLVRPHDPTLAEGLEAIRYASSAAVTLGYRRTAVAHPLDAFGVIVPRLEGRSALAITFSSVKYPGRAPAGSVLLRVFLGGALDEAVLSRDDPALLALARREVEELLGATGPPVLARVVRYPRAMPQYEVGHLDRVAGLEARAARLGGLVLAGAAFRGVGLADCVRSGEAAAEAALQACRRPAEARGRSRRQEGGGASVG